MRDLLRQVDRLHRLAVFDAAARTGSFTAAARELGMTQPAVTRQIRALERSLGVELFTRTTNRSELSDLGRRLHGHIGSAFDAIESGLAELAEHAGTFVLAADPGVAQQWIVPHIDGLQAALGDLELRLWLFHRDHEAEPGGFDAAVRVGTGDFPGQSARLLFREAVVPIASPAFAAEHGLGPHSTARDVFQVPFVHVDDGGSPWMTWAEWLSHFGIPLRRQPGRVMFNHYPAVIQQVLAGRGVGLGWRTLIDDLVDAEAVVVVGPEVRSNRGYYVTWQAGPPSDVTRAVIDWLTGLASADR